MEAQTCLTLVFPYGERDVFQNGFFEALTWALEDLLNVQHVATSKLVPVTPVTLSRLEDARLREALRAAEFICAIERMYHDDLRRVQRHLNQFPHDCPPDYVPADAVRRLFGRPPVRFA
jgi:hypothetical protein